MHAIRRSSAVSWPRVSELSACNKAQLSVIEYNLKCREIACVQQYIHLHSRCGAVIGTAVTTENTG